MAINNEHALRVQLCTTFLNHDTFTYLAHKLLRGDNPHTFTKKYNLRIVLKEIQLNTILNKLRIIWKEKRFSVQPKFSIYKKI